MNNKKAISIVSAAILAAMIFKGIYRIVTAKGHSMSNLELILIAVIPVVIITAVGIAIISHRKKSSN